MTAEQLRLEEKMSAFARTFHSLGSAPGVALWYADTLDGWAAETPLSHGELVTARFVLAVRPVRRERGAEGVGRRPPTGIPPVGEEAVVAMSGEL